MRRRAVCSVLSDAELSEFARIARQRTVPAGSLISGGDEDVVMANILSGVVKLTKTLSDGRQQIVALQFPPDFLGRTDGEHGPYFAEAATDVTLCAFPGGAFEAMLERFSHLEHRLYENALDDLAAAREWMLLLGRKTAQEKVASFLLMIARRAFEIGCHRGPEMTFARFTLPLTRADMADYLGLTLETVSRQITNLKTRGLIELIDNREIVVPDMAALEKVAEP